MRPGCFHPRNAADDCLPHDGLRGFNEAGMFPSQKFGHRPELSGGWRASMRPGCFHPRNTGVPLGSKDAG